MHPFSVGMQLHRMPTLTSRLDQIAARGLSQLTSLDFEMAYSADSRRMDMTQVTPRAGVSDVTALAAVDLDLPPRPNTTIKTIFWRLGRFKLLSTGSGRIAVQMSVMMLTAALENLLPAVSNVTNLGTLPTLTRQPTGLDTIHVSTCPRNIEWASKRTGQRRRPSTSSQR